MDGTTVAVPVDTTSPVPTDPPDFAAFDRAVLDVTLSIMGVVVAMALLGGVMAAALVRAGRLPNGAMLVVSLSLLATLALAGYLLVEAEVLATLAGTAIGAIAGAVTAQFNATGHDDNDNQTRLPPPPPPD